MHLYFMDFVVRLVSSLDRGKVRLYIQLCYTVSKASRDQFDVCDTDSRCGPARSSVYKPHKHVSRRSIIPTSEWPIP